MKKDIPTDNLIANIAAGLSDRLRSLVAVIDRLDRLESGSGDWRTSFADEELSDAATEMTLRLLRTVAHPNNFMLLKLLAASESQAIKQLIDTAGVGRLALSEQLNDLVQVGLASRLIDTDHAQITPAGAATLQLVEKLSFEVSKQYNK